MSKSSALKKLTINPTDHFTDYVSAVIGIFIIFVAVLWLFKRGSYQGPVSLECTFQDTALGLLISFGTVDLRYDHFSFAQIDRRSCGAY